jgi:hypothetical protein
MHFFNYQGDRSMPHHLRIETKDYAAFTTTRTKHSELWFINNKPFEEKIFGFLLFLSNRRWTQMNADRRRVFDGVCTPLQICSRHQAANPLNLHLRFVNPESIEGHLRSSAVKPQKIHPLQLSPQSRIRLSREKTSKKASAKYRAGHLNVEFPPGMYRPHLSTCLTYPPPTVH